MFSPIAVCSAVYSFDSETVRTDSDFNDEYIPSSLTTPHLSWSAIIHSTSVSMSTLTCMLIDTGLPLVLIQVDIIAWLSLHVCKLLQPFEFTEAFGVGGRGVADMWVKLKSSTNDLS